MSLSEFCCRLTLSIQVGSMFPGIGNLCYQYFLYSLLGLGVLSIISKRGMPKFSQAYLAGVMQEYYVVSVTSAIALLMATPTFVALFALALPEMYSLAVVLYERLPAGGLRKALGQAATTVLSKASGQPSFANLRYASMHLLYLQSTASNRLRWCMRKTCARVSTCFACFVLSMTCRSQRHATVHHRPRVRSEH